MSALHQLVAFNRIGHRNSLNGELCLLEVSSFIRNVVGQNIRDGQQLSELSRWALITAIVAIGMKTSFGQLAGIGSKAICLIVLETLFIALLVLAGSRYWLNP